MCSNSGYPQLTTEQMSQLLSSIQQSQPGLLQQVPQINSVTALPPLLERPRFVMSAAEHVKLAPCGRRVQSEGQFRVRILAPNDEFSLLVWTGPLSTSQFASLALYQIKQCCKPQPADMPFNM